MTSPLWFALAAVQVKHWVRRHRARRLRNPRPPAGETATVEGFVQPLRLVASPLTGLHGAVTLAKVAVKARDLQDPGRCAEVRAASDFLLLTASGPVLVRTDDVWIGIAGEPSGVLPAVPGPAVDALRSAGLGDALDEVAELTYIEVVVFAGDRVRVTGVLRDEPAPTEIANYTGYRDAPTIPTLSGGGGALRIG